MSVVSSVSGVGEGGVGSEIVAAEICAGRDDSEDAAWCLDGFTAVVGPLYATGFGDRETVRKVRYCPTLGT